MGLQIACFVNVLPTGNSKIPKEYDFYSPAAASLMMVLVSIDVVLVQQLSHRSILA